MTTPQHKVLRWLVTLLQEALVRFNGSPDVELLQDEKADNGHRHGAVGEQAMAHRFAVHLERALQDQGFPNDKAPIAVDCEYNRHRGAVKQHAVKDRLKARVEEIKGRALKDHPEREGWYVFSIRPDIIVHQRGNDENNLIAIELKRASNTIGDELDAIKLKLFTTQGHEDGYGYILGASITAFDEDRFGARQLKIGKYIVDPSLEEQLAADLQ